MKRPRSALVLAACCVSIPLFSQSVERLDYPTLTRIREEGFSRPQVLEHLTWLADVYGPRITGSPSILQASDWAMGKFREWGLSNIHREEFPFGKGWSLVRFSAHMIEPQIQPLIGYPKSWTPGTPGPVKAEVVYAPLSSEADFEKYRGALAGKIVLTQPPRQVRMLEGRIVLRMTEDDIREAETMPVPAPRPPREGPAEGESQPRASGPRSGFQEKLWKFLLAEKVVAALDRGSDSDLSLGGEEQGLLGSRAYVREHFGDPETMQLKPAHEKLSAYFNIDNGTGRILGIWMQGNMAVRPVFEQWLAPLKEIGVKTLSPRVVGSTDHLAFDAVRLPGFQFIQERLEYNSRSHHSNMDFSDRAQREDLIQMSTVAAIFAYNASMRDEKLPRKPLPRPSPRRERNP